jgi:hypothetical protein
MSKGRHWNDLKEAGDLSREIRVVDVALEQRDKD